MALAVEEAAHTDIVVGKLQMKYKSIRQSFLFRITKETSTLDPFVKGVV